MAFWRIRRPPEWGTNPVPPDLRILRSYDLFVLWSSLGVGLLVLAAGTLLVSQFGLTLSESFLVSLVGSVIGSVMLAAAAYHGSRAGVPTMVSLRPILGRRGSYVPTALNVFQLLGWSVFEFVVMGDAVAVLSNHALGPWTAEISVPLWAVIVAALALGGPLAVVRDWLERFGIWLVWASTAAIAIALLLHGLNTGERLPSVAPSFGGTTSLLLGLDLVVAMPVSWWPVISDYNRFARGPGDSALGTIFGNAIANTVFYVLGAGLIFLGLTLNPTETDFLAVMGLLGLSVLPLLIILVDETDNAFADVYSTAVSVQNLAPRQRQFWIVLAATLLGATGAVCLLSQGEGIGGGYESFLLLLGALFVPLLGTVIADAFLVRRQGYRAEEFFQDTPRWRWPAYASWIPGVMLYLAIVSLQLPVGATIPSFALSMGLHVLFSKVEDVRASHVVRAVRPGP
jgi:putative hydroxymethylpyrimidine transporter CytX